MMLVDSSVWIDLFNGHDSPEAAQLRSRIIDDDPLLVPGVVITEILVGVRSEADAERIERSLVPFDRAPQWDDTDYREAARIYRVCRASGATLRSAIDCLIAQTCLRYDFELLTKDRDFRVVARHFPLRLAGPASA